MTVAAAADAFATEDEMGIGGWIKLENAFFGSVTFGTDMNYNLSWRYQKAFNDIFLRGKH